MRDLTAYRMPSESPVFRPFVSRLFRLLPFALILSCAKGPTAQELDATLILEVVPAGGSLVQILDEAYEISLKEELWRNEWKVTSENTLQGLCNYNNDDQLPLSEGFLSGFDSWVKEWNVEDATIRFNGSLGVEIDKTRFNSDLLMPIDGIRKVVITMSLSKSLDSARMEEMHVKPEDFLEFMDPNSFPLPLK